jgi:phosphate transport system substrate-binding protein
MKITKNLFLLTIVLVTNLSGCTQKGASEQQSASSNNEETLQGKISLSGAFALYPLANIWASEFNKLHPGVRFNISAGGAGKGMTDALSGAVDLGMFSREIKEAEKQKGVWWLAVTKDAVLPTINANNAEFQHLKEKGLSQEVFRKIFISGEITTWGEATGSNSKEKINVYTRSDAAGAADTWAQYVGGNGQEALKGIGVFGDPGLAEALKKDRNGIGFNNVIYAYDLKTGKKYDGIEVIPIDANNNQKIDDDEKIYDNIDAITTAIGNGKYPSPPARELYFVSAGKPQSKAIVAFLNWVLTEGQSFIDEAGYVRLPKEKIESETLKLK